MFTFDLKSDYHHMEIFPEHRKYLSFVWTFSSGHTRFCLHYPEKHKHNSVDTGAYRSARTSKPVYCKTAINVTVYA